MLPTASNFLLFPVCFTTTYAYSQWINFIPSGTCTTTRGQYLIVTATAPTYYPIRIIELFVFTYQLHVSPYTATYSSVVAGSDPLNVQNMETKV